MTTLCDTLSRRFRTELELGQRAYANGPGTVLVCRNDGPAPAPDDDAALQWAMGHSQEGWPEGLPLPLTAADALAAFERSIDAMAEQIAADIQHAAKLLVRPELVKAALLRKELAERWPLTTAPLTEAERVRRGRAARAGWMARRSLGGTGAAPVHANATRPGIDAETRVGEWFRGWPGAAAPAHVAAWAREALNGLRPGLGDDLAAADDAGDIVALFLVDDDDAGEPRSIPAGGIALLFLVEQEIDSAAHRPAVRHDANAENHMLVRAMSGKQQDVQDSFGFHEGTETLYLTMPGKAGTQLTLPNVESLRSPLVDAVIDLTGPEGLRHWAAFQEVLSEQGSTGEMRWDLDRHLEGMGYSQKEQTRMELRRETAEMARLFTKLELQKIRTGPDGKTQIQDSRSLLITLGKSKTKTPDADAWITNVIELKINPTLYRGVRDPHTKRLGVNHGLAPYGLAKLSHRRDRYALQLGMNLGIRFRLAANERKGWVHASGGNWIETAGIPFNRKNPKRAWDSLDSALETLRGCGLIDRWEWERGTRTIAGVLRAWSAGWIQDRLIGGVRPVERPPVVVRTGDDLRSYREARGMTQAAIAELLGVGRSTILRAEKSGPDSLSRVVTKQIHRLR